MEIWRASQEGIDVVIVNPGVILGSGFWDSGSGKLFSQIYNGFQYYTEGVTGFVGVKDVVSVMIKLMESEIKNKRFILVAENKSFKDILFSIADAFNKKRPNKSVKQWQANLFWRWEWIISKITSRKARMSKYTAQTIHSKSYYSSEKIKQEVNFTFEKMNPIIESVCKDYLV